MEIDGKPQVDRRNLLWGLATGVATAVVFGSGGFFLVYNGRGDMGWVLFLAVPIVTGFAVSQVARKRNIIIASLVIGLIFCSAILIAVGVEGWVCVIMSAPLLAVGLALGAMFGWLLREMLIKKMRKPGTLNLFILIVLPFFLVGANSAERKLSSGPRAETFSDTLIVDAPPESVWNELKSMDNVAASKGFLMKIGLPVPVSCKTEGEGVGGKRTCYFESGFIEERITEWKYPNSMKFEITASEVPGRPWLTFRDASYEIQRNGDHTIVTRHTTIISRLSPAWYWRRLEGIGVHTEHQYLFEAVASKLKGRK